MNESVLNLPNSAIALYPNIKSKVYRSFNKKVSRSQLVFMGVTLVFLQILDGILTGVGVLNFGPSIEANFLIRTLIETIGIAPALFLVKGTAILIVGTLCSMAGRIHWLGTALKFIIVLYLFAAIIPWTLVLTFKAV